MSTAARTDILIPKHSDHAKWAVVSCDQFTSQRDYWERLDAYVGDSDSTLRLIFPEVYLGDGDDDERIACINAHMREYRLKGVFRTLKDTFVLVRRTTPYGADRLGLVIAADLEEYSFHRETPAAIRSTEGVVEERIPPRLAIRRDAEIELPHIILLADDPGKTVIETLYAMRDGFEKLYDFDLNMNGGHLTGYAVPCDVAMPLIEEYERGIYDRYGRDAFLYAVGDGNHSLATAQAHWREVKETLTEEERAVHPARYALCELENIHSDGVVFEPIHRVVFDADAADVIDALGGMEGEGRVGIYSGGVRYEIAAPADSAAAIAEVQARLDAFAGSHPECGLDYIHGLENALDVADGAHGVAVEMPKIDKSGLFPYVYAHGNLCRKAFSMGEAEEKRYYFEAKRIK